MRETARRGLVGTLILGGLTLVVALWPRDPRDARGPGSRTTQAAPGRPTDDPEARPAEEPAAERVGRAEAPEASATEEDPLATLPPDLAERFAEANAASDAYRNERAGELYLEVLRAVDDPAAIHPELWLRAAYHAIRWQWFDSRSSLAGESASAGYVRELHALAGSALGAEHAGLASVALVRAYFAVLEGDVGLAEDLATGALDARFRDARQMWRQTRGPLGFVVNELWRFAPGQAPHPEVAAALMERALEQRSRLAPDPERDSGLWAMELERIYRSTGDDAAAERVIEEWGVEQTWAQWLDEHFDPERHRRRVEDVERERGPTDEAVLDALADLSLAYSRRGDHAQALATDRMILERRLRSGAKGPVLAEALADVARLEAAQGRVAEAERLFVEAIEELGSGPEQARAGRSQRLALARLLEAQRRSTDAAPHLARVEEDLGAAMDRWSPHGNPEEYLWEANDALSLARIHAEAGRVSDAERILEAFLDANPVGGTPGIMARGARVALGDLLWDEGRQDEARREYRRAVEQGWVEDRERAALSSRSKGRSGSAAAYEAEIERVRSRLAGDESVAATHPYP